MLTEVVCPCDHVQNINLPEGQTHDLLWECSSCGRRIIWQGPDGPVPVTLPEISAHAVSIMDVDEGFGVSNIG